MKLFKNSVGRPSNETIRKRKIIVGLGGLSIALVIGIGAFLIIRNTDSLLNKTTIKTVKPKGYDKITDKSSAKKFYQTGKSGGGFLQAMTYVSQEQKIYYITNRTIVKGKKYINPIFKLGNTSPIKGFGYEGSYQPFKINDVATIAARQGDDRNYYLSIVYRDNKSRVYYNYGNQWHYQTLPQKVYNIGYNSYRSSFYSVSRAKMGTRYVYPVYAYNITPKSTSYENEGTIYWRKVCTLFVTPNSMVNANDVTTQTITIHNDKLYFVYLNGKSGTNFKNFIGIYDMKNCDNNNYLYPNKTYYLGTGDGSAAEIEGVSFYGTTMYLGFNTTKADRSPNFYTLTEK